MEALKTIQKTREYLDYIERHILNVEKAWKEIQEKCNDMRFVYDDYVFNRLDSEIIGHDMSKLEKEEFYPTELESNTYFKPHIENDFNLAWENHKQENSHHWEKWTVTGSYDPYYEEINCAHMVIDWLAMSYEFGDTPRSYYEKNKKNIKLPKWAVSFIYEIFNRLEKKYERI